MIVVQQQTARHAQQQLQLVHHACQDTILMEQPVKVPARVPNLLILQTINVFLLVRIIFFKH